MSQSLRLLTVGSALFALSACPAYTFLEVTPEDFTEENKINIIGEKTPVDILFVVDNSGSMEDEQVNLAVNFDAFIAELAAAEIDYQIGVVTTDLETTGQGREQAGLRVSTFENAEPKKLATIDNAGCSFIDIEHGCFRGPDANSRVVTNAATPEEQLAQFSANVQVGTCGSGNEQGLAGMVRGLERMNAGECNAGFLRNDANLVIVLVSDEDDQSGGGNVTQFIDQLAALKPLSQVRVAAIVGANPSGGSVDAARCAKGGSTSCGGACQTFGPLQGSQQSCGGGVGCPAGEACSLTLECVEPLYQYWDNCHWCSFYDAGDCCSALSGNRYVNFAKQLESRIAAESEVVATGCVQDGDTKIGCLIDSICLENFSDTLRAIATDLVIDDCITLNPAAAYPPGVVVEINGEQLVNGTDFTVNSDGNELCYKKGYPIGTKSDIYFVLKD